MQYVMLSSRTMCFRSRYISLLLLFPIAAFAVVVSDVRFKLSAADLSDAAALAEDCYRANGSTLNTQPRSPGWRAARCPWAQPTPPYATWPKPKHCSPNYAEPRAWTMTT